MGTWASGNFDNDCACDFRADIVDELLKGAQPPQYAEDIDLVMAAVEMILAICQRCGVPGTLFEFDAESLRREVLRVYDERFGGLSPSSGYRRGRREVITHTFDELQTLISR